MTDTRGDVRIKVCSRAWPHKCAMTNFFKQLAITLAAVALLVIAPATASAAVGSRLINGDGDTAGKCLEISNGGRGDYIQMAGCHTNAHQSWYLHYISDDLVSLRSHDPDTVGQCVSAWSEGVQVTMSNCSNASNQIWRKIDHANGWFQLRNNDFQGNQCLDVKDNGQDDVVQTWLCGPSNKGNQLWHWHSVG